MTKKKLPIESNHDNTVFVKSMDDVMHQSMLPYAEHVILERALPRVEDGLKPVQRRILYTMMELSLTPDKPHRKSARIVGDCLGKYHPHGDSSVYDALVRMSQDFNMCVPLVDGHGNYGSMDGDSAAAMRYTEARMTPAAMQLLRDIDKDTVKFSLNFDDTLKEPDILPGRFPNLLINGANGIAVGLTTSIPPHNPCEAIDAVIARLNDPEIDLDSLMKIIPGPDFPTGGLLVESEELKTAYATGRGKLINRAKTHFEQLKNGKTNIVVTEFPYQVNKAAALEKILQLVQTKKSQFAGISDIRDESDRTGIRAVIELKKDVNPESVLNALFKYSDLQKTVSVIMVAVADGKPKMLGLTEIIDYYIRHQEQIVTKRCRSELEQAERRAHILDGLMIALLNIDEVISLIRASKSPKEAKQGLVAKFNLTVTQAEAILDLRLQRLTNLEQLEIEREYKDTQKQIKRLSAILASSQKLHELIIAELIEIRKQIGHERKTQFIEDTDSEFTEEEQLTVAEKTCLLILPDNKIKRIQPKMKMDELIANEKSIKIIDSSSDKMLRLFTTKGIMLSIPIDEIPESKPQTKSINLSSLIKIDDNEKILLSTDEDFSSEMMFFYTRNGLVKCTKASEYSTKSRRIAAVNLKEDDELVAVELVINNDLPIMLVTEKGMCIRFESSDVPVTGRNSSGVKGIKIDDGDSVIFAAHVPDEGEILVATDRGYMKRSFVFDFEIQGRNGKGVQCLSFKKNASNGSKIVDVLHVTDPVQLIAVQRNGEELKFNSEEVKIEARNGKGQPIVMVLMDNTLVCLKRDN